jgi:hypothetical protein
MSHRIPDYLPICAHAPEMIASACFGGGIQRSNTTSNESGCLLIYNLGNVYKCTKFGLVSRQMEQLLELDIRGISEHSLDSYKTVACRFQAETRDLAGGKLVNRKKYIFLSALIDMHKSACSEGRPWRCCNLGVCKKH